MSGPPPPPPPHGEGVPKSSGLPPGKYDIFVIPEHSAGSGFLYLPSLQPNINSFVAGFASALILVVLGQSMAPAFRSWWDSFQGLGNMGMLMLIMGVGFGAWALGRTQQDGPPGGRGPGPSSGQGHGASAGFGTSHRAAPNPDGPPPPPPPHGSAPPPNTGPPPTPGAEKQRPTWDDPPFDQQSPPEPEPPPPKPKPPPEPKKPETPPPKSAWQKAREETKASWEKAREETRRKQEEQRAKEAEQKRREEITKRLAELRAKEAKERQARDAERLRKEKETKDAKDKEAAESRAKELAEKLERERKERERLEKIAKDREEQRKKDKAEEEARSEARKNSSYAYSGVGEKTSMWPNGRPPVPNHSTPSAASRNPPSPDKKPPPAPTARTYVSVEDEDMHSYRPYDQPRRRKKSLSSMTGSESSWAPSHTTAQTSPQASMRGPYTTKDPDKIVLSAVYLFMNQFAKTPASQLISGTGSVTDGLILRVTTEGLFIDDDVRGVPQREWDVKAWTLKLVEVWCPPHCLNSSSFSAPPSVSTSNNSNSNSPNLLRKARTRVAERNAPKPLTGDEAEVFLNEMTQACMGCCRFGLCERTFKDANIPGGQTGEWKNKGLHILRATVRDQEGKRYLFVVDEAESWKIAAGLQRLKRGPQSRQVRPLAVSSMSAADAKGTLEMLGWNR